MITDYSSEIKIAVFQSVSGRQRAKWATNVKFRSTFFTFYPYLTQNYTGPIFTIFLHDVEQLV